MKPKKSEKANLEKKRSLFLQIGLLISLCVTLAAFEWSANIEEKVLADRGNEIILEETVKIIKQKEKPKPIKQKKKQNVDRIEIKKDDEEISDSLTIVDSEVKEGDIIVMDDPEEPVPENTPQFFAKVMPKFRGGGLAEFQKWVQKKVEYSEEAQELGLEGKVVILFAVDEKGEVSNVNVKRGVDPMLDNEVVRVLKKSPKWAPAENNGFKVKIWFYLPVTFKIND